MAVSAVSLIGGASLGAEKALGTIGGRAGSWISQRSASTPKLPGEHPGRLRRRLRRTLSSPVIMVMMILEVARPGGQRFTKALVTRIVASSVSFGIYFAIAGAVSWTTARCRATSSRLAAARRGSTGPVRGRGGELLGGIINATERLLSRLQVPSIARSTLGGVVYGSSAWPCR